MNLNLARRSTTEIVVLFFTFLICVVMIITIVGVMLAKFIHPDMDLSKAGDAVNGMINTIIGALVGFISGRAYGKREQEEKDRNGIEERTHHS